MKKLLLTLAGALLAAPAVLAETVTLDVNDATDFVGTDVPERPAGTTSDKDTGEARKFQPLESLKLGDFSFAFSSTNTNASSQPAYYFTMSTKETKENTIRVYGGTTMTLSAPEGCTITAINFKGSNAKKLDELTVNSGELTVENATSSNFSWAGEAQAIDFTFAGTYRVKSLEITYTTSGVVTPAAEAPVFSPESCGFTGQQVVTISAAEGAKIYYTLDGSNPTEESTLYEAPIVISATTTVKAIAVEEGKRNSAVASATYTLEVAYNTLASLIEAGLADKTATVKYAGNATVAYQNGRYLFLQDESGVLLAYGALEQTYAPGDVITGFAGKMTVYNNLTEMNVDAASFAAPVSKVAAPVPAEMDIEEVTAEDANKFILLKEVRVVATTVDDKTSYKLVDAKDADIIAYPRFTDVTFPTDAEKTYNVEGFVSVYKEDLQIFPISFTETAGIEGIEAEGAAAVWYNLQGQRVSAPAKGQLLIKVQGDKAVKVIF